MNKHTPILFFSSQFLIYWSLMEITTVYLKLFLVFLQLKADYVRAGQKRTILEILTISLFHRQHVHPISDNASLCHDLQKTKGKEILFA